jgi:hypothetical protein
MVEVCKRLNFIEATPFGVGFVILKQDASNPLPPGQAIQSSSGPESSPIGITDVEISPVH